MSDGTDLKISRDVERLRSLVAREMESTNENNGVVVPPFNKVEFLQSLSKKKLLVSLEKTEEDPHFPRWAVVAK